MDEEHEKKTYRMGEIICEFTKKITELYTLNGQVVCYLIYISIKLLFKWMLSTRQCLIMGNNVKHSNESTSPE